ncbi:hypothetical protein ACFWZW_07565 [Microbacterium enclense]|uniref:hypothetical protein n=1 Tax=Microbacterium enclense TaxID=993073 RepID=UPI0036DAF06A
MTPPHNADNRGVFVDADGVKRRTILAGAAWSIPVISVATTAPAFAATTDLKLAFDKSSYSGTGCGTITGVKVTATRNGVAAAGESVTVTLADGYTFSDGSTSYTATTGSDGSITLPDIKVPSEGGSSSFSASGGGASASASVSSTASDTTGLYVYNTGSWETTGPVANSKDATNVVGDPASTALIFQTSDGVLRGSGGTAIPGTESGVNTSRDLLAVRRVNGQDQVWYKKSDGLYYYNASTGTTTGPVANSKDAVKIVAIPGYSALVFQNSDGSIHGDDGTLQTGTSSGVDTGAGLLAIRTVNGGDQVWYKKSDGLYYFNPRTGTTTGPVANSKNAVRIVADPSSDSLIFQNSDGSLHGESGGLISGTANGVETGAGLVAIRNLNGTTEVWYKKSDGLYVYNANTGATSGPVANSENATQVVATAGKDSIVFQNSDGSIRGSDGSLTSGTATGVSTGAGLVALRQSISSGNEVWYKKSPACS